MKANEFMVPANPQPKDLEKMLALCSNHIATLSDKLAEYQSNVAVKTTAYKRAFAQAVVLSTDKGRSPTISKAAAEADLKVIATQDELDIASAVYTIAKGEFDGWNAHFVALRKMAEIRKSEMFSGTGPR